MPAPTKSCVNDKDACRSDCSSAQSGTSNEAADLHAYHTYWCEQQRNRTVYSFAQSEGNDRCRSPGLSTKSSANNNSADQSAHLQSPEPTTEARSASSSAKSCANNDVADQPAHSPRHKTVQINLLICSLKLAFGMPTNVGPTRINNDGPTLNQRNLYNMSYVGPTLGHHVGPTEAR